MKTNQFKGIVYVLASAVCFSLAGLFIKIVPWSSFSIQAVRSFFALFVMGGYMVLTHHKFVLNRAVFLGAACNTIMSTLLTAATKMTTAANAIVLQFTEPFFVVLLMWIIWKVRPSKATIITCVTAFAGMIFFFVDDLSMGSMLGNILAILSGLALAGVFLAKQYRGGDMESAIVLSYILNILVGIWWLPKETEFSVQIWLIMLAFGMFQFSFSYIFLSRGLDYVTPVTASLLSMLEPILNPILVAVFYGEVIGPVALVGALLVIGATVFYSVRQAKDSTDTVT